MNKKLTVFFLIVFCMTSVVMSQEFDPYVSNSFRSQQVITLQTTKIPDQYSLNLNLQHKFGMTNLNKGLLEDFFGMDLTSNIRFGFYYRILKNAMIGVGRTKFNKTVDFEAKYKFLSQRIDNGMPVSAAFYMNASIRTAAFPSNSNLYFPDSVTPFQYKPTHRWNYLYQLIVDRRMTNWLSIEVAPLLVYRNLARPGESNITLAFPVAGRIKVGLFTSILFEYSPILTSHPGIVNPVALAFEIATTGHSFQIYLGNTYNILSQNIYVSQENTNPLKGKFYLGFNVHRRFWLKKNMTSS